jgi:hypothetical protein
VSDTATQARSHPVELRVDDDLRRNRLTVFFRLLLVIPHWIVVSLWGIAAFPVALVNWFATLFTGRSPEGLHRFLASWLRYSTRVNAYTYLAADPFPPFGSGGSYPVDLEIAPPERQSRWKTLFRVFLAIPALVLSQILQYLLQLLAFLGWFAALALGRMPEGMRDLEAFCLRYSAQTNAYLMLLTDRYPTLSAAPA